MVYILIDYGSGEEVEGEIEFCKILSKEYIWMKLSKTYRLIQYFNFTGATHLPEPIKERGTTTVSKEGFVSNITPRPCRISFIFQTRFIELFKATMAKHIWLNM